MVVRIAFKNKNIGCIKQSFSGSNYTQSTVLFQLKVIKQDYGVIPVES